MKEFKVAVALMYKTYGKVYSIKLFREFYKTSLKEALDIINRDIDGHVEEILEDYKQHVKKCKEDVRTIDVKKFIW